MSNNDLTDEQKTNYAAVNKKFGIDDVESTYQPQEHAGKSLTFSADPAQSDIPPRLITVQSIADLKALIGNAADRDDTDIDYPAAIGHCSEDQIKTNLLKAARAYVLGKPEKVKDYEPLINAQMFPMSVAYFAAATPYIIDQPVVVTGPSPVAWNYPDIVFKPGGSITADVDFTINCTTMSKES